MASGFHMLKKVSYRFIFFRFFSIILQEIIKQIYCSKIIQKVGNKETILKI